MATYRTLEDYGELVGPRAFKAIRSLIHRDLKAGLIDRNNYEELMEDLETEIDEARQLGNAQWP
jgi:hypothetical protein